MLADSLSLPRKEAFGNIPFEITYPFLLESYLRQDECCNSPLLLTHGMRARTIKDVLTDWPERVELIQPDIVVIHVGIVDCAPRVFLQMENKIISKLKPAFFQKLILDFVNKHRRSIIQLRPNRVYIPLDQFQAALKKIVKNSQRDQVKALVLINIITPPDSLEYRSPGFQKSVEQYNHVLADQIDQPWIHLLDINRVIQQNGGPENLTIEGIHINSLGHELLAHELHRLIVTLQTQFFPNEAVSL